MEKKALAAMILTLASGLAFAAGTSTSGTSSSGMSSDRMSGSSASDASAFDRLDANKDGTLSRSEFDVHVQEMQRMKGHHGSGKMGGSSTSTDSDTRMQGSDLDSGTTTKHPDQNLNPEGVGKDDAGVAEHDTAHRPSDQ